MSVHVSFFAEYHSATESPRQWKMLPQRPARLRTQSRPKKRKTKRRLPTINANTEINVKATGFMPSL